MGDVQEVELKPCPFCSGEARKIETDTGWRVECDNDVSCNVEASVWLPDEAEAIIAWNTRPASTGKPSLGWSAAMHLAAAEARRYAAFYPRSSDGQNTFLMLADWAERQAAALPVSPFKGGGTDLESTSQSSLRSSAPSFALPDAWRLAGRLLAYDGEFDTGYRFIRVGDDERPGWLRGATSTDLYENVTGAAPPTSTHAEEG